MSYWLKLIGFGLVDDPCPEVYEYKFVDFPKQQRPRSIQVGDRMILYACGGSRHVFADAQVTSEVYRATWPPSERRGREWETRFPHRMDIEYTVNLPVSSGVHIDKVSTSERNLLRTINRGSYFSLRPEEYARAASLLRAAAKSHPA